MSSSKRISSFITITSPVSLWVTCGQTETFGCSSSIYFNLFVNDEVVAKSSNPAVPHFSCLYDATYWAIAVQHKFLSKRACDCGRHRLVYVVYYEVHPTLMAWPKQPFPSTSPWMRSDGRKIRCVRLDTTRSDSDRLMSFLWETGDAALLEHGDLSML